MFNIKRGWNPLNPWQKNRIDTFKERLKSILFHFIPLLFIVCALNFVPGAKSTEEILETRERTEQSKFGIVIEGSSNPVLWEYNPQASYRKIVILNPVNESLFPPDIAAPFFEWIDKSSGVKNWLVQIKFESKLEPIHIRCDKQKWIPSKDIWEVIKLNSRKSSTRITVLGYTHHLTPVVVSKGEVRISTSEDPVGAPILFRRVPPSFSYANEHPESMEWCLADISSYGSPPVIMSNQQSCASCHTFSRNGDTVGMDMDYSGDKGSYFLSALRKNMVLEYDDFISWNDFPRDDGLQSSGLFSRLSPDGNYVASTVNDISFLAKISNPYCSQLFFPIQGHLAFYTKMNQRFSRLLTGEQRREIVETDPSWSADGKSIIFSRTVMTRDLYGELGGDTVFSAVDTDIKKLNAKYPVRFDVYQVPFNSGRGGQAVPMPGASNNGMSNYFARCSPDGRWIVFTQSHSGIVLQPDSRLFIMSADGGEARMMDCNLSRMNSWHTWSPNSRWLAFVSKENMPYTELYLTHIDENGHDSVPVLISRFNKPGYAVNVPEFVDIDVGQIHSISLKNVEPR